MYLQKQQTAHEFYLKIEDIVLDLQNIQYPYTDCDLFIEILIFLSYIAMQTNRDESEVLLTEIKGPENL